MKKVLLIAAIAASISLGIACSGGTQKQNATEQTAKADFTCPMHPEVHSDKAGKCPSCGMDLVKNEQKPASETPKQDTVKH